MGMINGTSNKRKYNLAGPGGLDIPYLVKLHVSGNLTSHYKQDNQDL